ncbi:pheromone-regulated protein prm10 [Coemansia erecta]|uniref:Pheromone-regulated protein prm10 n=1 Tax=Coemansia erecta TaxID=147472 RepID=A0A9W7Y241_9FUNG|nr:pheromone-regulated protein prm10 [Coemansia erecta]
MSHAAGGGHTGGAGGSGRSPELSPIIETPEHEAAESTRRATESPSSSTGSSTDGGLFMHESASLPPELPADAPPGSSPRQRPVLRLAMLNAQEKAQIKSTGEQHPATAPVRSLPLELPSTGYFAPRGTLGRANSSYQSPPPPTAQPEQAVRGKKKRLVRLHPALRFASRDSVHTFDDNNDGDGDERSSRLHTPLEQVIPPALGASSTAASATPPGLRRRLTKATNNLVQLGRALNPVATGPLDSGSETETESGRTSAAEDHMERLLDQHAANTASRAPTNNIAANNAEIASHPDFYPINPSTANPGVVHVSMSGHEAAKNIVDSMLGAIGTSTKQHAKAEAPSEASPADLEAGLGRLPSAMPHGLTASPTSLRGVYANLSKLQSRMAEHHEKREKRLHELRQRQAKEEAKRARDEARRKRHRHQRSGDAAEHDDGRMPRWNPLDRLADRRAGGSRTQPSSDTEDATPPPPSSPFVLHSFRAAPRPASIAQMADSMRLPPARSPAAAAESARPTPSPQSSPAPSAMPSPVVSPAATPGWDELLASSGMLTGGSLAGGSGSRLSTLSMDSTQQAFEAERQKILAQLADIFNRQNFLLVCSRALMGFGAPMHRLEASLVAIALNLDVQATFAVLPGIILITFGDEDTRTSETYVVRMSPGYDMRRLERTNRAIRRVLKGRIQVGQGVRDIERILATPPIYPWWAMVGDYAVCSFFICPLMWNGGWKDAGVSMMLGLLVGLLQLLAGRFANYANLFEVSSAFLVSFIAALLQDYVCFATVSFAGVAMLLPGLALTTSIIEMVSRNMISGTVRFVFALARCFILGYGISVGSTLGTRVLGRSTSVDLLEDQMNSDSGLGNCSDGLSKFWWFLFLPALSLAFSVSISAHWRQWPSMLVAGCLAYTTSYFSGLSEALAPLAPAIAAFAMGLYANIMASFSNHRSAVEPILGGVQLLVPGSLGLRTVLAFITSSRTSSGGFLFDMFSASLSIAAGLFLSGMVVFPNRKKRVGLMTF